jgi:hypothetical protein
MIGGTGRRGLVLENMTRILDGAERAAAYLLLHMQAKAISEML